MSAVLDILGPAACASGRLFGQVRAQVGLLAQGEAQVLVHSERPWASVTFSGSSHSLELMFDGETAVAAGEHFVAELSEHEFAIPGQLVADASVVDVEHRLLPQPRLRVRCELLLVENG